MYSALVELRAMIRCFFESHEIAAPLNMKAKPAYDRLSTTQLAQSASTKSTSGVSPNLYSRPLSMLLFESHVSFGRRPVSFVVTVVELVQVTKNAISSFVPTARYIRYYFR